MEPEKSTEDVVPNSVAAPPALAPGPSARLRAGWPARLMAPGTGMLRALRHPNYRLFWTGNFLSNIGTWMQQVALGWLVLEMTNSPFLLGVVGFMQFIPALLFSLLGGVIADRVNRRTWLMSTQSVMMLLALGLALLVSFEVVTYTEILILTFLLGTAIAMNAPAFQAMVRDLSSREDVLNAIAMNSMQFNLSRFIGPAVAGILISTASVAACFYVNSLSYLAPVIALSLVKWRGELHPVSGSMAARLAEGFRYLRGHGQIVLLVSIVGMVSLFGLPYLIFLPVFARDILEVGARGLGYMTSASGAGALLGALTLATWRSEWRRGPLVLGGSVLFFSGVLLVALSKNFYLSLFALVVTGGAMVAAVATVNSLIQTLVPDRVRGRVLSWHTMAYFGLSPVGSLLVGWLASSWGTPVALALSAGVPLAVMIVIVATVPWLRHLQ